MPIEQIGTAGAYAPLRTGADAGSSAPPASAEAPQGSSFAEALGAVIREANQDQIDATRQALDLVVHGRGTIHDAMVAVDNAEGSFRLLMEMRNRLVEGVNRLLETQV